MAKIYVASSWKNDRLDDVLEHLVRYGNSVYDFRAHAGFHWSEVFPGWDGEEVDSADIYTGLSHPLAEHGFRRDMGALEECDTCVLVLPAGNSAHLELGWAAATSKRTAVLLPEGKTRPDLMWRVADIVTEDIQMMCRFATDGRR